MAYVRRPRRRDGFLNLTSSITPTLAEGKIIEDPGGTTTPPIYIPPGTGYDQEFEIDFYGLNCKDLQVKIDTLSNILAMGKWSDPAIRTYYEGKLAQANSAWQLNCGSSTGPIKDPINTTITEEPSTGGGSATPTPITPTVNLPTGSTIKIGPGVASGGAGGGGFGSGSTSAAKKTVDKKKNNWWIWAAAAVVLGIALYQTQKD